MKESRCGCDARIFVKKTSDNKYKIASFVEHHNHGLVTPSKHHLIRSNRRVNEKAKTTLYSCQKASIGTSQAFRLLHVSAGGFENVGCTKRDLQNYYCEFKNKINNCDAQMFVDQLGRMKELNPAFYFDYDMDEDGRMLHVFWEDATARKNYSHFGDVLSFDSTYTKKHYNMIFAPFSGVDHHMQSVFFGSGFVVNERIASYKWLFETFLKAMGGKEPRLIITDEDASMREAMSVVLPNTKHRLCMWHIMKKLPEKIGPHLREEPLFWVRVNSCVWGSETAEEFESKWHSLISDFQLEDNEWLATRYKIRKSWIPAYFMDIFLAGVLRTTSRSESANSFFNRFIGRKLALVEFWLRFDTALQCQRQEELIADNTSMHTTPQILTTWGIERKGSELFTHEVFNEFQKEVVAAREPCDVQGAELVDGVKIVAITDASKKVREVCCNTSTMVAKCSCMLFESLGIPCRHIVRFLRGAKVEDSNEPPNHYVLKRWEKNCKR